MTKLPAVSARESIRVFQKAGDEIDHQTGSHINLRKRDLPHRRLTVPNHRILAKGTLRSLIRQAGLSIEEFSALL